MNILRNNNEHIQSPLHTILSGRIETLPEQARLRLEQSVDDTLNYVGDKVATGARKLFRMPGLQAKNPPIAESLGINARPEAGLQPPPFAEHRDSHDEPPHHDIHQPPQPTIYNAPLNQNAITPENVTGFAKDTIAAGIGTVAAPVIAGYPYFAYSLLTKGVQTGIEGMAAVPLLGAGASLSTTAGISLAAGMAAVPLATGYIGSRLMKKHPVVGAMAGSSIGAVGMYGAAAGIAAVKTGLAGLLSAAYATGGTMLTVASGAIPTAILGGGMFANGRLRQHLRKKPRAGILKTIFVDGIAGLATNPYDLLTK
ncbi:MAG: hypothetical protein WCG83_04040 [Candidatus Peregrinibacteria bacterium]